MPLDDLYDFEGTERFQVLSCLGSGGMGVVYEAYDNEQQTKVALKTLKQQDPNALFRLKNEFRALLDINHPNLVALGELFEKAGQWFITMEFIRGVDFIKHVRGDSATATRPFDEQRLRRALPQLVQGLMALHEANCIHRDIKPSNVLVTPEERVVLLDFGLIAQQDPTQHSADHFYPVGTASYMAPEQAAGHALGPQADWYSVGVILFEALTGQLPYSGSAIQIMLAKQEDAPPRPRDLAPDVPEDLDSLCWKLMQFHPADRPRGAKILRRLNVPQEQLLVHAPISSTRRPVFVGRQQELATMLETTSRAREGQTSCLLLHGASGLGKSELLRAFTSELRGQSPAAVLLSGRCYMRESVPFKAFDGVVDALSRQLRRMDREEVASITPRNVGALTRVFPVLGRVQALRSAPQPMRRIDDLQELRALAFRSLRELLARLADHHPLVILIDDLQWAGEDSLRLLRVLLQSPEAPAISLIAALRTPSPSGSAEVPAKEETPELTLTQAVAAFPDGLIQLEIRPLPEEEARELAVKLLDASAQAKAAHPQQQMQTERIVRESAGHPLFIHELAQHAQTLGERSTAAELRLEDALYARIAALDPPRRALVELVTVAGGPIPQEVAMEALGIQPAVYTRLMAMLRVAHLLRTSGIRLDDTVEPFHDRVRVAVLEQLSAPSQRRWHKKLAQALEVSEQNEPELLALHFGRAGHSKKAAQYAAQAATEAAQSLAFDRAARLFAKALALLPSSTSGDIADERRRLWIGLGDALTNAGRGGKAAGAYLKAMPGAKKAESLELARRAADQLFRSGHLDKGLTVTRQVLSSLGMRLPRTPFGALVSLLGRRLGLRLRGINFRQRDESQIAAESLIRVDLCYSVAVGLAIADHIRGADFSTRFVRLALDAGEPRRVLMALASEATFVSAAGGAHSPYVSRLLSTSERLLEQLQDPIARAYLEATKAFHALESGFWSTARLHAEQGESIVMDHGGTSWERATARFIILWSLYYLGELAELTERLMPLVQEALDRGDRFALSGMVLGRPNLVYLNLMGPVQAREEIAKIMHSWKVEGYHLQHFYALFAETSIDLYEGAGKRALERLAGDWPALKRSLLLRLPLPRNETLHMRARAALSAAPQAGASEKRSLLARVRKDARRMARSKLAWTSAISKLLQAGVSAQRGNDEQAIRVLEAAVAELDAAEMKLYAAAARRRLGALMKGDAGAEHIAVADTFMQQQNVTDPARMTAMLAPGLGDD